MGTCLWPDNSKLFSVTSKFGSVTLSTSISGFLSFTRGPITEMLAEDVLLLTLCRPLVTAVGLPSTLLSWAQKNACWLTCWGHSRYVLVLSIFFNLQYLLGKELGSIGSFTTRMTSLKVFPMALCCAKYSS